jgi:hypothetical protein
METKNQQLRKALDQIFDRYSDEVGEQKVPPPAAYTSTAKPSTAMRANTAKSSTWAINEHATVQENCALSERGALLLNA